MVKIYEMILIVNDISKAEYLKWLFVTVLRPWYVLLNKKKSDKYGNEQRHYFYGIAIRVNLHSKVDFQKTMTNLNEWNQYKTIESTHNNVHLIIFIIMK